MNDTLEKYQNTEKHSQLGQRSSYSAHYDPQHLFIIPRALQRQDIGLSHALPFYGFDCWNHFEVSWLNEQGKPQVAVAEIMYDCASTHIIESKSMKLYFNSLNNTVFKEMEDLRLTIAQDLANCLEHEVHVKLYTLKEAALCVIQPALEGECLDDLDIVCSVYQVEPNFLSIEEERVEETLYSDLLKSNCLVTNQPDWASVQISYKGPKINREGLLQYLVSFRNHNEFHEQCIERIFMDIMRHCKPEKLSIYGRYTRRGGLDINPYRSSEKVSFEGLNGRLIRQ